MLQCFAEGVVQPTVTFLNQSSVKQSIKFAVGTATFSLGVLEICDVCLGRGDKASPEIICAKISIILSAATSPLGAYLIAKVANLIFTKAQLERVFGPNTTFQVNPWHPRHVASIAAVALAIPSIIPSLGMSQRKISHFRKPGWLSDSKLLLIVWFNLMTSRLVLHVSNLSCKKFLHLLKPTSPSNSLE